MIVYDLKCGNDHVFEAWFQSSAAYETQAAAGDVVCPVCADTAVSKALMAPAVSHARKGDDAAAGAARVMAALGELRAHVEKTCDYVGAAFPEEARKMHYGEAEKRDIYGEASETDAEALRDEGIEFQRIPWPPRPDA